MKDLHDRFRTLDELPAPDLWHEAVSRAQAMERPSARPLSWALIAMMLLLALAIGSAALIGSGVIKFPALVDQTAAPSSSADSTLPPGGGPLGGGLLIVHSAEFDVDKAGFDVFTLDAGTGQETLLGTLPNLASHFGPGYSFQWGADRQHVLITGDGPGPNGLENLTDAGRQLTVVCCELPDEVVQLPPEQIQSGKTQYSRARGYDWVLSPQSDRIAGLHDGPLNVSGCQLCSAPDSVVVMNITSGSVQTLPLPVGTQGSGPISWSPDGAAVLISGCRPCNNADIIATAQSGGTGDPGPNPATMTPFPAAARAHLFIVPVDGSPVLEMLDEAETGFTSPTWSPDGKSIAFARSVCPSAQHAPFCIDAVSTLVTLEVANGQQRVVAEIASGGGIVWSTDGRRITFEGNTEAIDGPVGIYVMEADGNHLARLADGSAPRWSPDGRWLLFTPLILADQADTPDQLWIVAADGGDPRLLGNYGAGGW